MQHHPTPSPEPGVMFPIIPSHAIKHYQYSTVQYSTVQYQYSVMFPIILRHKALPLAQPSPDGADQRRQRPQAGHIHIHHHTAAAQ